MKTRATTARGPSLLFTWGALLSAALPAQHKAIDSTVGACTRKEEFAKRQAEIDVRVQELTQAVSSAAKAEIGREIASKWGQGVGIENLIRYRETDMVHVFRPLLAAERWPIRTRALYGLKMTGDAAVVPEILRMLEDSDARVRECAANALCHLADDVPPELVERLESEAEPRVRASLEAAIATIRAGERPYRPWKESLVGPAGATRVEWAWQVKGKRSFSDYDARTLDYPRADRFDWPISWYEGSLFSPVPRKSFGANGNHAGEDMAWFREGASVCAVADGLVRVVQGAGGNWGFFLLVEHRLESGEYVSSIYGHTAWDVLVKPGDVVRRGQRIATVGLSCSVENGGYGAHLHFGIGDGPFRRPPGVNRGATLDLKRNQEAFRATVLGFAYLPEQKDQHGFPGLGLRVRTADGQEQTLSVTAGDIGRQVGWITGYAKGCVGWLDPYAYIKARLPQ